MLIFRTVARAGSISSAARELGWTQPAVSQQLQRLEREVACSLLIRGTRGVTLTQAGAVLLDRADAIAGQLDMAAEEIDQLADLRAGRVRLVAFPSAAAVFVPPAVQALNRRHSDLEVSLVEAEPPEASAAIRAGEADVALVFDHEGPPPVVGWLTWVPVRVEPVLLVLPPEHPATRSPAVRLRDLAEELWVGGCERCRQHLVATCRAAGFAPRLQHESDDYVVVQNLVARGLGVTLLPQSALTAFRHPDVVVRSSSALGQRHIGLAYRPGAENVPATRALIRELVHVARPAG